MVIAIIAFAVYELPFNPFLGSQKSHYTVSDPASNIVPARKAISSKENRFSWTFSNRVLENDGSASSDD